MKRSQSRSPDRGRASYAWADLYSAAVRERALAMLTETERRRGLQVIAIALLAALSSGAMVLSVMPFLMVISNPKVIQTAPALRIAHAWMGAPSPYVFLFSLGVFALAILLAASAMQILRTFAVEKFAAMLTHSLSQRLLASYLARPYEFFLERNSNDLSATLLSEADEVVRRYYRPVIEFASSLLTTVAVVAVLAWANAPVALLAAVVIGGAYGGGYLAIRGRMRKVGRKRASANQRRYQFANEALHGIKDIRILGREQNYLSRFEEPSRAVQEATIVVRVLADIPRHIIQAAMFSATLLFCMILISGTNLGEENALGDILPLLGVFAFAGQRLIPELQRLYGSLATIQFGSAAADRVYADLVETAAPSHAGRSGRLTMAKNLEFRKVSYAYPGGEGAGVSDLSFEIKARERIGIAGSSGAGKTTLGDIVLGLLAPSAGALLIDGVQIDAANVREWQRSVGFVPQEIFLSDASVAENIALGLPPEAIDRGHLEACARAAKIHAFVMALPARYETRVGERGMRLSGGQRQRIAIARALYKGADLIVFDEATSALDTLTENEVMDALTALPGDKTILIIAHRLSTLEICDRILVLDEGGLAGYGSREELGETCVPYRNLVAAANRGRRGVACPGPDA